MNTRERIARAAYEVEQREFGGVDWDYPGDDLEGPADTAAAYEIADAAIAIVREAMLSDSMIARLAKHAYEHATPPPLSEISGDPTWEEACQRQHTITAILMGDIADIVSAEFGVDKYGRPLDTAALDTASHE